MNFPKKILLVAAFPPNNQTAGQSNTNAVIDDLINCGSKIDLVCFSFKNHYIDRRERFGMVKMINDDRPYKYFYSILLFFLFPLYTYKFSCRVVWFLLKNQRKYDLIYFDYSQMFIYSWFAKKSKNLLFVHDLIFQRFSRAFKKKWFTKFIESYVRSSESLLFRRNFKVLVLSFKDKILAKQKYNIDAVAVMQKNRFEIPHNNVSPDLRQFVFLGVWARQENLRGLEWFVQDVYPLLEEEYKFVIIGNGLTESFLKDLPGSFSAVGFINNFSQMLQLSSALLSPLFSGAGIKFKVLDALSKGCRIIGTDIAFEGIDIESANILFTANTPDKFAKAIAFCSRNAFEQETVKNKFRSYMEKYKTVAEIF